MFAAIGKGICYFSRKQFHVYDYILNSVEDVVAAHTTRFIGVTASVLVALFWMACCVASISITASGLICDKPAHEVTFGLVVSLLTVPAFICMINDVAEEAKESQ